MERPDWYHLDADSRNRLGEATSSARKIVRRTIPTRAFYGGMPADRFWEFEDDTVRFGAGSVGRTDLAHLLLDEFALSYGNDWYTTPLRLPVGTVCDVDRVTVRDTFGIETVVPQASSIGTSSWNLFHLSTSPGAANRVAELFVLPPALGNSQQGDPLEEVVWFRDEMANVVWAVEKRTASPVGGHLDRAEFTRRQQRPLSQHLDVEIDDAELVYRLNSNVPENWFPLVPVRPTGAPAGVIELELRPITRFAADRTATTVQPAAQVLRSSSPLRVAEEEILRDGTVTSTHWQLTRGSDGRYRLWLSHRRRAGAGEGSSGLVFDIARPVKEPASTQGVRHQHR